MLRKVDERERARLIVLHLHSAMFVQYTAIQFTISVFSNSIPRPFDT